MRDLLDQGIGMDALDRRLARRIDGRHIHHVGVVEGLGELVHQIAQPRIAVRLHHRDDPAARALARRRQHRADLDRVVAVIVDDRGTCDLAHLGEAPLDPAELGETLLDRRIGNAQLQRHADRGERVLDIVAAGHRQFDILDRAGRAVAIADDCLEPIAAGMRRDVHAPHIGARRKAIGHDPPVTDARDDRLHFGMIEAQQRRTVEGHVLDELDERRLHLLERAIMVEMLGIDVGHDREGAVEPQEAAVALIRLDDHPVALAQPGIRAVLVDDPAVDHGRVHPAGIEDCRDH